MELTKFMVDRKNRLAKLPNGRNKTGQEQTPYLNETALHQHQAARHVSEFMSRLENGNRNGEHEASPEQTGSAK